jgi:integrase
MRSYSTRRSSQRLTLRQLRRLHVSSFQDQVRRGLRSAATLEMHERTWRYITGHFGAGADARRLSRARIRRWVAAERRGRLRRVDGTVREIAPPTIRLRVCTLRSALKLAKREGVLRGQLPEFPATAFRYVSKTAWLESFADYERIMAELPLERQEYFALAIWTWQRPSDVEKMLRGDIYPWGRSPWVILRSTKNRRAMVRVRCPAELARIFRAKFEREGIGNLQDRLVRPWPGRVRTLPLVCRRLGLPRITCTAARHTGITWAIRNLGITPAVARWSGHRSTRMLEEVYGHAMPAQLREVALALDSMRPRRRKASPADQRPMKETPLRGANTKGGRTPKRRRVTARDGTGAVPRDRIELSTQGFSVPCVDDSAPRCHSSARRSGPLRHGETPWTKDIAHRR